MQEKKKFMNVKYDAPGVLYEMMHGNFWLKNYSYKREYNEATAMNKPGRALCRNQLANLKLSHSAFN